MAAAPDVSSKQAAAVEEGTVEGSATVFSASPTSRRGCAGRVPPKGVQQGAAVSAPSHKMDIAASTSSTGTPGSEWDIESQESTSDDAFKEGAPPAAATAARSWGNSCRVCLLLVAAVVGMLIFILWPHRPVWEVASLKFKPKQVQDLIAAITDPEFNETAKIDVVATAVITNGNYVGGEMAPSRFIVEYGGHKVADVAVGATSVNGRGTTEMVAEATSIIDPELSRVLLKAVMPDFQLAVSVTGEAPVTVPAVFGIHIFARVSCIVNVNVIAVVQDPNEMVTGHRCSYSIHF